MKYFIILKNEHSCVINIEKDNWWLGKMLRLFGMELHLKTNFRFLLICIFCWWQSHIIIRTFKVCCIFLKHNNSSGIKNEILRIHAFKIWAIAFYRMCHENNWVSSLVLNQIKFVSLITSRQLISDLYNYRD